MFRYSGTAWDGQKWRVAKSIQTLGDQIMELRGTTESFGADGTVASKAHDETNPNSDHTVKPKIGSGVVYAIDFHEARMSVDDVLEAIRQSKDNRVLYGIHDRRMFSSYPTTQFPAWTWRPYGGTNGHPDHGHLSVQNNLAISDDPRPWAITLGDDMASKAQIILVDFFFNLDPDEFQGLPSVWYDVPEDDAQWDTDFRPAASRAAQKLYRKTKGIPLDFTPGTGGLPAHDHPLPAHSHKVTGSAK